jgi:hypothetical protein
MTPPFCSRRFMFSTMTPPPIAGFYSNPVYRFHRRCRRWHCGPDMGLRQCAHRRQSRGRLGA